MYYGARKDVIETDDLIALRDLNVHEENGERVVTMTLSLAGGKDYSADEQPSHVHLTNGVNHRLLSVEKTGTISAASLDPSVTSSPAPTMQQIQEGTVPMPPDRTIALTPAPTNERAGVSIPDPSQTGSNVAPNTPVAGVDPALQGAADAVGKTPAALLADQGNAEEAAKAASSGAKPANPLEHATQTTISDPTPGATVENPSTPDQRGQEPPAPAAAPPESSTKSKPEK